MNGLRSRVAAVGERRAWLVLLGTLALIVGVLGMHTFAEGIEAATTAPATMSATGSEQVVPMIAAGTEQPVSIEAAMPAMAAMSDICVLALLVGLLLLCALPALSGTVQLAPRAEVARAVLSADMPEPRPPSLSLLSISRV